MSSGEFIYASMPRKLGGNLRCAVVYYAWAVRAFSAGIKCWHCTCYKSGSTYICSPGHPCLGNWVAIRRAVVYYAWAVRAFSAGIKCWHCTCYKSGSTYICSPMHPCPGNWVAFRWQLCIMPGLSRQLVQELNVGTVH